MQKKKKKDYIKTSHFTQNLTQKGKQAQIKNAK